MLEFPPMSKPLSDAMRDCESLRKDDSDKTRPSGGVDSSGDLPRIHGSLIRRRLFLLRFHDLVYEPELVADVVD
jgi:hypothetical protein